MHGTELRTDPEVQRLTNLTMAQFDDSADGCLSPHEFVKVRLARGLLGLVTHAPLSFTDVLPFRP